MNKLDNYLNTITEIHEPCIILITGASGTGKTTIVKALKDSLGAEHTSVFFFDDIGIPSIDEMIKGHGSPEKWQQWATHNWIDRLHNEYNKKVLILEGSFYPEFALQKMQELRINNYMIICLSTERSVREKRLIEERCQPGLANQDMENYAMALSEKTLAAKGIVIDSTRESVANIVNEISNLIESSFALFAKNKCKL